MNHVGGVSWRHLGEMTERSCQLYTMKRTCQKLISSGPKDIIKLGVTMNCRGCVANYEGAGEKFLAQIRPACGLQRRPPKDMKAIERDAFDKGRP